MGHRGGMLSILLLTLTILSGGGEPAHTQSMWVTGYYPYWAMDAMPPWQINWNGLTHVVHFFARPEQTPPFFGPAFNPTDAGELIWGTDQGHAVGDQSNPDTLIKYAHLNGVKVILSLGGIYGGQDATVNYISQDQARTTLWIQTAGAFCKAHGYDGMELDWERPLNATQVNRIITTMRAELDSWQAAISKRGILVVAVPGWDSDANAYSSSITMIDQYNILGYDLQRPNNLCCGNGGPADVTGFNAALHRADPAQYPIVSAISDNYDGIAADAFEDGGNLLLSSDRLRFGPQYCIQTLNWPAGKIGMGVPFYGWMFAGNSLPNQQVAQQTTSYMQYQRAADALAKGGTYHFDVSTQTPWIGGTATSTISEPYRFVIGTGLKFYMTYEDTNSIKSKVAWARQLGLGGMMMYALDEGWNPAESGDNRDPLLRALAKAVNNLNPPPPLPVGTLTASSISLPAGGGIDTLTWTSTNATGGTIDHGVGAVVLPNGSTSVTVSATTTFSFTLSNGAGVAVYYVSIAVAP
jgi:GH18 family chitinase